MPRLPSARSAAAGSTKRGTSSLRSYGGQRLRAHYTVPRDTPASGRFPAMLAVPGYGGGKEIPYHVVMHGFAVLTLFPRAQGESIPEWDLPEGSNKLTYNVTDRDSYYYRAGYMDCVRGVDFLAGRDEVDPARIGMWSRSQGGGFTLATAALDHRLAAAVAEEPFMCNYPLAIDIDTSPYHELRNYVQAHPEERPAMLDTLRYFDTLTLADAIECPTLVNIGMADTTCPYDTIMPVFERIRAHKSLLVYPDLTHSPCTDFNVHAMNWLKRYLGT